MTNPPRRADIAYDPYAFELAQDPYPVWQRMRDEAPLYFNDEHGFYALSRYEDVREASFDWRVYSSAKGSVLEIIKSGIAPPPGSILFEDPPLHDEHRAVLQRLFTPRRIAEIEPKVRHFCQLTLDRFLDTDGFDAISDLGALVPMQTIGYMIGIPAEDQEGLRETIDQGLSIRDRSSAEATQAALQVFDVSVLGAYVDWRVQNPSDDLMTELLNAVIEDEGTTRKLKRREILNYIGLLIGAGAETTTRLIGWAVKVLAEHPGQRAQIARDPALIPRTVEELLRYESPSPVQARWTMKDTSHHGQVVPEGSILLLMTGAANRDDRVFPAPDVFDIHREGAPHLAFGHGLHNCLGAHLARLEARIALEELFKRWAEWDIDEEGAVQAHTSTVRGWEKLPLRLR